MRAVVALALAILLLRASAARAGDTDAGAGAAHDTRWKLFVPDQIPWQEGPPSLLPGAKMAILEGDPAKEGFFTMRLKVPDGYRVPPHFHSMQERVTVLSGTLNLGTGTTFDPKATKTLPAGTYSSMPPGMSHFGWTSGETILQ